MQNKQVRFSSLKIKHTTQECFRKFFVCLESSSNKKELFANLNKLGLVTFEGVQTTSQIEELALSLGQIRRHRDSNERGITVIAPTKHIKYQNSNLGFTSERLFPHTDGSSERHPPTLVLMVCGKVAEQGGLSVLVDGKAVYEALNRQHPSILNRLKASNSVIFGLEPEYKGAIFEKISNDNYIIRFRFDKWVRFCASLAQDLPILLRSIEAHSFPLALQNGQGFIIQNGRWLHGRSAFTGDRLIYRVLVDVTTHNCLEEKISFGFHC